jgi:endonuclease YncB( thermonuclease family)
MKRFWSKIGGLALVWGLALVVLGGCTELFEDDPGPEPTVFPSPAAGDETGRVTRVIDGDTIDVRIGTEIYRVRYVGINTPERDEPCYDDATAANAALVDDQVVMLVRDVSDTDRYGRLLRYVYVGDVFVNAELVAGGFAEAGYYPPDTGFTQLFEDLEAAARRNQIGCHPTGVFR